MWEKRQHTGSAGKTAPLDSETTAPMGHSLEVGLRLTAYPNRYANKL